MNKTITNQIIKASIEASKAILKVRENGFDVNFKFDNSPVTLADINSSDAIISVLKETNIPLIGEEIKNLDYQERKKWNECIIFDPLDGTREFAKNSEEFCVCIAYVVNQKPVFGLITSPTQKRTVYGGKEMGTFSIEYNDDWTEQSRTQLPMLEKKDHPEAIIMSRFEKSAKLSQFTADLKMVNPNLKVIKKGSALKFFDLAMGIADVYPRFAPTMEWDISAGQAILEGVGGAVLHLETKQPLYYNKENLKNPYFIASGKI